MKKIIFDLDGTLWETGDAYVYSYNKTCDTLKIPQETRRSGESVKSFLGMKLEELVMTIIPGVEDKETLGKLLLMNVIEYLVQNPQTYGKNLYKLFEELAKDYELYIISNCPRPFLEAFYQVSGIKALITGDSTIEESNKIQAIKRITKDYSEKALFVGDAPSDYDSISNHSEVYFVFAAYGYKECDKYDFYLKDLESFPELLKKIKEMDEILKNDEYEIVAHRESYCALIQKKDCKYFGFLNITALEDLDYIIEELKTKTEGQKLLGPINGNSWFNYRLALNEFDFKLYPDCLSDQKILQKFYDKGFEVAETYTSTVSKLNMKAVKKPLNPKLPSGYDWKIVCGEETNDYLEQVFEVSARCFEGHDFYEPIDVQTFKAMYMKSLRGIEPVLIMIFYNEKLVGFNFCYPDPEKRFYVQKTFAIDKDHRKLHVLFKLLQLSTEVVVDGGYEEVLLHFQQVKNKTMQSYFKGLLVRQKKYGVLKYENTK